MAALLAAFLLPGVRWAFEELERSRSLATIVDFAGVLAVWAASSGQILPKPQNRDASVV